MAASCGSDSEDTSTDSDDGSAAEAQADATDEPTEDAQPEVTEDPTEAATDEATEEPTAEVELFDSYEGVTADSIEVGVISPDLDELREMGLVDVNNGDVPLIWDTLIADFNANGGVLGRQLELSYTEYNPVFTESADEACIQLTEDEKVFVVLGGIAGPARDSVICIVETNPTPLIGGVHTPEHLSRAVSPWIATDMASERRHQATLALYDQEGLLEGNIAVFDDSSERETISEAVVIPALNDLGYEVTTHVTSNIPQGDEVALADSVAVFAERLEEDGIDTLLIVQSQINLGLPLMLEAGFEGTILTIDTAQALDTLGSSDERDPAIFEGVYSPFGLSGDESLEFEASQACVEAFTSANPDIEVLPPSQVPDGDPSWWGGLAAPCRYLEVLKMVGEAAGADLNPDTFLAAAEGLGSFELPGRPFNSLGTGKLDADDNLRVGIFDPSLGENGGLVAVTELQDVG